MTPIQREIITISENGIVTIPNVPTASILMRDFEIAQLFEVYSQTVKANIKAILKSGVITSDCTHGGTVISSAIIPDYFGLDMITALAFRIQSHNAKVFREYIVSRLHTISKPMPVSLLIQVDRDKQSHRLMN